MGMGRTSGTHGTYRMLVWPFHFITDRCQHLSEQEQWIGKERVKFLSSNIVSEPTYIFRFLTLTYLNFSVNLFDLH